MKAHPDNCQPDLIAAYIDGELDEDLRIAFEKHVAECRSCDSELRAQRLLMCELDSALAQPLKLDVPRNFAKVVAVQAKSDLSGARSGRERLRAFTVCLLLAGSSFALLGATTGRSLLVAAELLGVKLLGLSELIGKAIYDAAAGLSVILRVAGGAFMPDAFAVLVILLLLLAVLVLTILITAYHRYPRRGLYE
jgi:anti-sigma factor RsiW